VTFEQFVAARLALLLRYATVVSCDPHLAEDIVQEVLLRVQPRWARIVRLARPEAYVKRMVLNEFLSWRRRRAAREVPLSHAGLDTVAAAGDPTGGIGVRDELVRRIAALPPKQRAVIALRYYEGLADSEIAVLLDCREVTVRSQASRALATLRGSYQDGGAETPTQRPKVPIVEEQR
jgi:RNA polymerase sigma-70 factor (sigma-E family)